MRIGARHGSAACGGSDALVMLAPLSADGVHRAQLSRVDAGQAGPALRFDLAPHRVPTWKERPQEPLLVGPTAPGHVAVPLRTLHAAGAPFSAADGVLLGAR